MDRVMIYDPRDPANYCRRGKDKDHVFRDVPRTDGSSALVLYCQWCGWTITVRPEEMATFSLSDVSVSSSGS